MTAAILSQHDVGSSDLYKSNNIATDCMTGISSIIELDVIDKPVSKRFYLEQDVTEDNIFLVMKYESNRLYSFRDRWPLTDITPESLAEAGFFYLQEEDKVQCPFCYVVMCHWTRGDKPLREHMRNQPKCPFLLGSNVGNVPLLQGKQNNICLASMPEKKHSSNSVTASYKPKHPRMADIKRRILTFSGWPLNKPEPHQLAECGLYYSGIADVVTCFFCGGTLGNWDSEDNPWNEHAKYFRDCQFLSIYKIKYSVSAKNLTPEKKLGQETPLLNKLKSDVIASDVIKQALDIFPESLVFDAVKKSEGTIISLQSLCDHILELKQPLHNGISQQGETSVSAGADSISENGSSSQDTLLCKLCMDRERGIVFQPCGHLISCWQCSNLISDCPVCRSPITYKIRTYLS